MGRLGKRWLRMSVKAVFALFLTLVLLGVGVALLSQTRWVRDQIQRALIAGLSPFVNGTMELSAMAISPWGQLRLEKLALRDPAGQQVLSLDSLRIAVEIPALLQHTLRIESLELAGLALDLSTDEQGRLNLLRLFRWPAPESKTPGQPSPWIVDVERLRVKADRITFRDQKQRAFSLSFLELSARVKLTEKESEVAVDRLWLQAGTSQLRVSSFRFARGGEIQGQVDLDLQPDTLRLFLPELNWVAPLTLAVRVSGPALGGPLEIEGQGRLADGALRVKGQVQPSSHALRGELTI